MKVKELKRRIPAGKNKQARFNFEGKVTKLPTPEIKTKPQNWYGNYAPPRDSIPTGGYQYRKIAGAE